MPGLAIADGGPSDLVLLDSAPEADRARGKPNLSNDIEFFPGTMLFAPWPINLA